MIDPNEAPDGYYACVPDTNAGRCFDCVSPVMGDPCPSDIFGKTMCRAHNRKDGESVIFKSLELTNREKRLMLWALERGWWAHGDDDECDPYAWLGEAVESGDTAEVLKGVDHE